MTKNEQIRFISEDLYNELRWMLVASTEWDAHRVPGSSVKLPNHFSVVTMDSACVHARALYEFFLQDKASDTASAERDFGVKLQKTTTHSDYIEGLNKRVFHLDTNRPAPVKTRGPVGGQGAPVKTDVNQRIKDLAQDVLSIWDAFTASLSDPDLIAALKDARFKAIKDADLAAASMKFPPAFS